MYQPTQPLEVAFESQLQLISISDTKKKIKEKEKL